VATKPTITDIAAGGHYDASALNSRFNTLKNWFSTVLGTDGVDGTANTMSGNLDMDDNRIINVGTATAANDAVTKAYVDANVGESSLVNADAAAASAVAAALSATDAETAETAAELAETNAAASAASINLPSIVIGDAKKLIQVNAAGDGYDLASDPIIASFANATLDTDPHMAADSDTVVPSKKAIKAYADSLDAIKATKITIELGTSGANYIKVSVGGGYNSLTDAGADDLTKGNAVGTWALDATGQILTWNHATAFLNVLSASTFSKGDTLAGGCDATISSANMVLTFWNSTGSESDLYDIKLSDDYQIVDLVYVT